MGDHAWDDTLGALGQGWVGGMAIAGAATWTMGHAWWALLPWVLGAVPLVALLTVAILARRRG